MAFLMQSKKRLLRDWQGAIAIAQRILLELWRRQVSLVCWVIFPVSILLVNGLILAKPSEVSTAEAFSQSVPPCLVGTALFFSCLGGSIATLVAEREQRTLKRLLVSSLRGTTYFLGVFLAYALIGLGQTLLIYLLAASAGAEFQGSPGLCLLIIILSMVVYVGTGFCIGATLARRTEDVNALVAALGVPLLLLSGALIPIEFFPDTLQQIARFNPIYHMIEALFEISVQGELTEMASHLWVLIILAGVMPTAGCLAYRQMIISESR